MARVLISTVTPVYRGERYIHDLVSALAALRRRLAEEDLPLELAEAIFVDDAAVDGSSAVLEELAAAHPWVRVVHLSRNFGQHPATVAGILHTSGDWVATLDEDLQHDPGHLLALLHRATASGCDVVYARPAGAVHRSVVRDGGSRMFKALVARLTGTPHAPEFNSYRLMRGSIARAAAAVSAHDTYFDVALGWFTGRIATLAVPLEDRRFLADRASGYDLYRLLAHARRLMLSADLKVLRLGSAIGLLAMALAVVGAIVVLAIKLFAPQLVALRGWTSLILVAFFFGGLSTFLVGMVLELLAPLTLQGKGKPTFFVVDRTRDGDVAAAIARVLPPGSER